MCIRDRYLFSFYENNGKFAYDPITPMMSSSGMYSGGEPCSKVLSAAETAQIKNVLKTAIQDYKRNDAYRNKGEATISFFDGKKEYNATLTRKGTVWMEKEFAFCKGK
eukprot:TRINITY_DN15464_c0_g1_i1.p1 TRINITY_DN15464_c0_g1~~TRINITY_DN15464_c0_g1_i1.p1  ORF type:complete len:108 (-),score=14.10 TRINITY_DN15464_c0_g1_i1:15-338(-)